MADCNIKVAKNVVDNKTVVSTKILQEDELLNEISRLSGGLKDNEISLQHAKELKDRCSNYKKSIK